MSQPRVVRAPRGTQLTCKSWLIEAPYRMIQNNLDPEVAERPQDLVVYGGRGQAARSWEAFDAILEALRNLENDETLLVQSGKPVAIFKTHPDAPRVLIANSNLVPHWATQEHFDELVSRGLMMFGQMTAGSWIYIGTQGILQGTYETLGSLAQQRGWISLQGKFVLTAGLGGMGGAQPLAITMNEGVGLIVEVDPARAQRRLEMGYVDVVVDTLEEAMTLVEEYQKKQAPKSIGLIGNAAEVYPELDPSRCRVSRPGVRYPLPAVRVGYAGGRMLCNICVVCVIFHDTEGRTAAVYRHGYVYISRIGVSCGRPYLYIELGFNIPVACQVNIHPERRCSRMMVSGVPVYIHRIVCAPVVYGPALKAAVCDQACI